MDSTRTGGVVCAYLQQCLIGCTAIVCVPFCYWRQQWHLQDVRIIFSSLIIIPALYLGLRHLPLTWELVAQARQTEQVRNTFTTENITPAYTLSNLDWQTSWDGSHFEDQWHVVVDSTQGLEFSLHADIPTAGARIVIVHVEVEWFSGMGYAVLVDSSQRERDQVAVQSTSPRSFDLIAYTSDLDFITLAFTAIGVPGNVTIRIDHVSVYTLP
ncbi:MAG: hypothetical protein U0694_00360 [Anaerolineae bacterium]